MRIQILHSSIRIFGLSWNKWVENCVVEWKFTKLKVFPPLRPFGASAEGNSRHFSSKITSSENPVKHRYRICLSTFFLVYSLDGFLSQIFYFHWAAKAKITTATECDASSSWSDENRNPSNGLKVIMSNRNVNNPIKISFFLLVLCLCVCFQAYVGHMLSRRCIYYIRKPTKLLPDGNLCTKAIDDIIINFLSFSRHIFFSCACVFVRWWWW